MNHPMMKEKGMKGVMGKLQMVGRMPKGRPSKVSIFHKTRGKMK